jgi:hypothetical protein
MSNLFYLVAFLGLPVLSYFLTRNLTWTVAVTGAAYAVGGILISFSIASGVRWNLTALQLALLVCLIITVVLSFFIGRRSTRFTLRYHLLSGIAPMIAVLMLVLVSRALAALSGSWFTAVGFLMQRVSAEDNAQWLDFSSQLAQGGDIVQATPMGGPLQLFMALMATMMASVSFVAFGGVNEVFVATNSVVYAKFGLAVLAPMALVPLVEFRRKLVPGSSRRFLPAPVVWTGMLALVTASLAASGLGHLTLQFIFIPLTFWVAIFAVGSSSRYCGALATIGVVASALVWFPLTPIAFVLLYGGVIILAGRLVRQRSFSACALVGVWGAMIVLTWQDFLKAIRYITDTAAFIDPDQVAAGGGGVVGGVSLIFARIPSLDLLSSQGGTEQVSSSLSIAVLISAVLAALFIRRIFPKATSAALFLRFAPAILLAIYSIGLLLVGSWWSGAPPTYGALKSAFLVSMVIFAVAAPLAIMELDPRNRGRSVVRFAGITGVIYVLAVDGLLTRAVTNTSPTRWPSEVDRAGNYWWPAEVKPVAHQPISNIPIGCAFFEKGAVVPTALPDGQRAYSCTRLLVGLAGQDMTAQPVINWVKREWLTNTPAWFEEYPALQTLPPEAKGSKLILMDSFYNVVGLETIGTFLDRAKPEWAIEQEQQQITQ